MKRINTILVGKFGHDAESIDCSREEFDDFMVEVFSACYYERKNQIVKKYKVTANEKVFYLSGEEIARLLGKKSKAMKNCAVVQNVKKRGIKLILVNGILFKTKVEAAKHFKCAKSTIYKNYEISDINISIS